MKSYYMKKEPVVKKMCFIVFKKYYHLSSRHVNKKVNNPEVISTHKTRLFAHFLVNTRAKLRLETLVPLLAKKCLLFNSF